MALGASGPSLNESEHQQQQFEGIQNFSNSKRQQNPETSTPSSAGVGGYAGAASGRPSSTKKRGGKGGSTHQSAQNVFFGLYRVYFKMDGAGADAQSHDSGATTSQDNS